MKRLLCLLLVAALVGACPVSALQYTGSERYMAGKYYQALTQVPLTGDQRTDIVNIALSQLGYQEGGSGNQLSGEVFGGVNHTEFGSWYGMQDMWCAMFVSWCAERAGVSTNVVPKHAYTPDGLRFFRDRGQAHEQEELAAGGYIPRPGDLIYFRSSRTPRRTNHVGLVTGYANGVVYTIEGNIGSLYTYTNGGMVTAMSYPVTNTFIVAVCSPKYAESGACAPAEPGAVELLSRTFQNLGNAVSVTRSQLNQFQEPSA